MGPTFRLDPSVRECTSGRSGREPVRVCWARGHMVLWHGSGSALCVGPGLGTGPARAAAHAQTSRLTATLDLHPERMQVTDISALAEVWPACSQEPGGPPSCRAPVWVLLSLRSKTSSTRCQSEFCRGRRVDDRVCWFLLLGSRACSVCTTTQGGKADAFSLFFLINNIYTHNIIKKTSTSFRKKFPKLHNCSTIAAHLSHLHKASNTLCAQKSSYTVPVTSNF